MSKYNDYTPDKEMLPVAVKWLALISLLGWLFYLFLLPLFVTGKTVDRQAQKFDAETAAQVYDNSRQYQQGLNRDIARYCFEYTKAEGPAKKAVADLIHSTLSTYQGELTPQNATCLSTLGE